MPYLAVTVSLLFLSIGCAAPAVSPTDQAMIEQAEQLHTRLRPALVDSANPRLERYLQLIGGRITAAAKELDARGTISSGGESSHVWMFGKDISFHIVDSSRPNSFSSGGKHVYLYQGLFDQCKSEDELATLLCHEYAHVYARHTQSEIRREGGLGGDDAVIYPFATLRHSPIHGRSAESIAFTIYAKAGWDPARYWSLYERLATTATDGVDAVIVRERVIEAKRRADDLPPAAREWQQPPVADDGRFAQLQAEAKSTAGSIAPNERAELLLAAFPSCLSTGETRTQLAAREKLFPPSPPNSENKWGKGLSGRQ